MERLLTSDAGSSTTSQIVTSVWLSAIPAGCVMIGWIFSNFISKPKWTVVNLF